MQETQEERKAIETPSTYDVNRPIILTEQEAYLLQLFWVQAVRPPVPIPSVPFRV